MGNKKESNALPVKSCSIERLVTVPKDVEKVLTGTKTAPRRNGVYADIGEIMELHDKQFKVDSIYSQNLGEMTDEHAKAEGYANLDEYKDAILSIHPGMRWSPKMRVWVHEYSAVQGD